jgi:hypothetical protein
MLLVLALGCGGRAETTQSAQAPAPADLAADTFVALGQQGSAHFVLDATFHDPRFEGTVPLIVHAEGGASARGLSAEGSVDYGLGPLEGKLLLGEREVLVYAKALDAWYGSLRSGFGLAKWARALPHDQPVWLLGALSTAQGLRAHFDDVVTGRVVPGPDLDGMATWEFAGSFDAEGLTRLVEGSDEDLRALQVVARTSRLVIVVGRDDRLPRRIELEIDLTSDDVAAMHGWDAFELPGGGVLDTSIRVKLSGFGEPVSYDRPANFRPLDELFEQLFAGFD